MIEFKVNVKEVLPYDRERYIDFLNDDFNSFTEWCAVSFQLNDDEKVLSLMESVEVLGCLFKSIILKLDNGSFWIVNHDDKDLNWFPDYENNLISLRALFKQNNVQNTFRGCLMMMKAELFAFSKDLISCPYVLSYKNLDISHGKLPFVLKNDESLDS